MSLNNNIDYKDKMFNLNKVKSLLITTCLVSVGVLADAAEGQAVLQNKSYQENRGDTNSSQAKSNTSSNSVGVENKSDSNDKEKECPHRNHRHYHQQHGEHSNKHEAHHKSHVEQNNKHETHHKNHAEHNNKHETHHKSHAEQNNKHETHHRNHAEHSNKHETHHRNHAEQNNKHETHHRNHAEQNNKHETHHRNHAEHSNHTDRQHGHVTEHHGMTSHNRHNNANAKKEYNTSTKHHHNPHAQEPVSLYNKGTKTNIFGEVDFHYAYSDNDDAFKFNRFNREHYFSTTYSIGGFAEIWIDKNTRVGAILELSADKDKRYALDLINSNNKIFDNNSIPATVRTTIDRPYVDPTIGEYATPQHNLDTNASYTKTLANALGQGASAGTGNTAAGGAISAPPIYSKQSSGTYTVDIYVTTETGGKILNSSGASTVDIKVGSDVPYGSATSNLQVKAPKFTTTTGTPTVEFGTSVDSMGILKAKTLVSDAPTDIKSTESAVVLGSGTSIVKLDTPAVGIDFGTGKSPLVMSGTGTIGSVALTSGVPTGTTYSAALVNDGVTFNGNYVGTVAFNGKVITGTSGVLTEVAGTSAADLSTLPSHAHVIKLSAANTSGADINARFEVDISSHTTSDTGPIVSNTITANLTNSAITMTPTAPTTHYLESPATMPGGFLTTSGTISIASATPTANLKFGTAALGANESLIALSGASTSISGVSFADPAKFDYVTQTELNSAISISGVSAVVTAISYDSSATASGTDHLPISGTLLSSGTVITASATDISSIVTAISGTSPSPAPSTTATTGHIITPTATTAPVTIDLTDVLNSFGANINTGVGGAVNSGISGLGSVLTDFANNENTKATLLSTHLERASVYVETKFGRVELGKHEDAAIKLKTDASSIAHGTGGIGGSWFYYANLAGVATHTMINNNIMINDYYPSYLRSDYFYQPTTYTAFHMINAPKVSYFSPDVKGFRLGASYTLDQADDNPFVRFADKNSDSYKNVFAGAAEYAISVKDIGITMGFFGEFAKHNERCSPEMLSAGDGKILKSQQCVQNYQDLKTFGFGGLTSFAGITFAASYSNMMKSGQKLDVSWNPDWYLSLKKTNPAGNDAFFGAPPTAVIDSMNAVYKNNKRAESKRGVPTTLPYWYFGVVEINNTQTGVDSASIGGAALDVVSEFATGGIVLQADGAPDVTNMLMAFPLTPSGPASTTEIELLIEKADNNSEYSGDHDSYYLTAGLAYEMGPAGVSVTYLDAKTQQRDAWGGRTRLQTVVASLDYELARGFTPYIEFSYFRAKDRTYGFLTGMKSEGKDIDLSVVDSGVYHDTLFNKMYGDSIFLLADPAELNEVKKSIVNENKGYTVMLGAKMNF